MSQLPGTGPYNQPNTTPQDESLLTGVVDGLTNLAFKAGELRLQELYPEQYAEDDGNPQQRDPAVDERLREVNGSQMRDNLMLAGLFGAGLIGVALVLK